MMASSDEEDIVSRQSTKKKIKHGRLKEVAKKLKLQSFETGNDCNCKKKCFECVGTYKKDIIEGMIGFGSNDAINSYLGDQISVIPVNRRRPRNDAIAAKYRDANVAFRVRYVDNVKGPIELNVCKKAFMSLHGIGRGKVEFILASLKGTGNAPIDKRGKHGINPHAHSEQSKELVRRHINSLKTRESYYCLKDTSKKYLPEDLNVTKLHNMFKQLNPDVKMSLESYREIFLKEFNIGFGYPRKDTCSQCDMLTAKKYSFESELHETNDKDKTILFSNEIQSLNSDKGIHLLQANEWYDLKRKSKALAKKNKNIESIVFDYAKNYPVPNVSTNDMYYIRQLSVFLFNIDIVSTGQSVYYVYNETVGHKGSDEVCSFLRHFIYNILDPEVTDIEAYCGSCAGQNKNNYVFKFFHHLITKERKLNSVTCSFPVRGNSFNECDKNSGLIPQKTEAELPKDWAEALRHCRVKPSPFQVIEILGEEIKAWPSHLYSVYRKKLGCLTRPIKIFKVQINRPAVMSYKTKYGGPWRDNPMLPPKNTKKKETHEGRQAQLQDGTFILPGLAYEGQLNICKAKYQDLQCLKMFCRNPRAFQYYSELSHDE